MSVDMKTTVKTWNDVPEEHKTALGILLDNIQTEMLEYFNIIGEGEEIDDLNDNGNFPDLDVEVHALGDSGESTRRLVITSHPEKYDNKYSMKAD